MTHDEIIKVIRAKADGKCIWVHRETDIVPHARRVMGDSDGFDFVNNYYEVKPKEPREWWLCEDVAFDSSDDALHEYGECCKIFHVREVLGDK